MVRAALKVAPLLVVRPGELRRMEWKDVSLVSAEWRFLVTKTKTPHIVPLCKQKPEAPLVTDRMPLLTVSSVANSLMPLGKVAALQRYYFLVSL